MPEIHNVAFNRETHYSLAQPQNHRITECSGLEGTSVDHVVQHPAEAGSPTAGCTEPCPGGSLSISREGDSTTSLGSLFRGSITLRVQKFFPSLPPLQYCLACACPYFDKVNFSELSSETFLFPSKRYWVPVQKYLQDFKCFHSLK